MDVKTRLFEGLSEFERGHLQLSFGRSLVALAVALAVSVLLFSGVWVAGAYGVAFWVGRAVALRVRSGKGRAAERVVGRAVARVDYRPGLVVLTVFMTFWFLVFGVAAFGDWVEERGGAGLLADDALTLLVEAFVAMASWTQPIFAVCAVSVIVLGAVSGLTDGFWVGSVQSRTGARFRETIPFGRAWADWRQERRERRQVYLRGGG